MTGRVLVAGLGNVFLGDDGFGVEVVRRLAGRPLPANVEVADIGIRGVHLAFELLDGVGLLILADAAQRGEPPGTLSVIEADAEVGTRDLGPLMDAHDMGPDAVLSLLYALGGSVARTFVVACEPARLEPGIGLSDPVSEAVDSAVAAIERLTARHIEHIEHVEQEETHADESDQGGRPRAAACDDRPVAPRHQALSGTARYVARHAGDAKKRGESWKPSSAS
jgi:hydrogenase maturation protease